MFPTTFDPRRRSRLPPMTDFGRLQLDPTPELSSYNAYGYRNFPEAAYAYDSPLNDRHHRGGYDRTYGAPHDVSLTCGTYCPLNYHPHHGRVQQYLRYGSRPPFPSFEASYGQHPHPSFTHQLGDSYSEYNDRRSLLTAEERSRIAEEARIQVAIEHEREEEQRRREHAAAVEAARRRAVEEERERERALALERERQRQQVVAAEAAGQLRRQALEEQKRAAIAAAIAQRIQAQQIKERAEAAQRQRQEVALLAAHRRQVEEEELARAFAAAFTEAPERPRGRPAAHHRTPTHQRDHHSNLPIVIRFGPSTDEDRTHRNRSVTALTHPAPVSTPATQEKEPEIAFEDIAKGFGEFIQVIISGSLAEGSSEDSAAHSTPLAAGSKQPLASTSKSAVPSQESSLKKVHFEKKQDVQPATDHTVSII